MILAHAYMDIILNLNIGTTSNKQVLKYLF